MYIFIFIYILNLGSCGICRSGFRAVGVSVNSVNSTLTTLYWCVGSVGGLCGCECGRAWLWVGVVVGGRGCGLEREREHAGARACACVCM